MKHFSLFTRFYLDVKGRNLDTEKLFTYQAVSRFFLSVWPHLVIPTPGSSERAGNSPHSKWKFSWGGTRTTDHRIHLQESYHWGILTLKQLNACPVMQDHPSGMLCSNAMHLSFKGLICTLMHTRRLEDYKGQRWSLKPRCISRNAKHLFPLHGFSKFRKLPKFQ